MEGGLKKTKTSRGKKRVKPKTTKVRKPLTPATFPEGYPKTFPAIIPCEEQEKPLDNCTIPGGGGGNNRGAEERAGNSPGLSKKKNNQQKGSVTSGQNRIKKGKAR